MLAFDLVPGVRREFARHTMGLAGRLPRLSRGVPLR
jgi:2-octaprenyl-6-methoxyphenol hydroxylase